MTSRSLRSREVAELVACHDFQKQSGQYDNQTGIQYGPGYSDLDRMWTEALYGSGAPWYSYDYGNGNGADPAHHGQVPGGAPDPISHGDTKYEPGAKNPKGGGDVGGIGSYGGHNPDAPDIINTLRNRFGGDRGRPTGGGPGGAVMAPGDGSMAFKSAAAPAPGVSGFGAATPGVQTPGFGGDWASRMAAHQGHFGEATNAGLMPEGYQPRNSMSDADFNAALAKYGIGQDILSQEHGAARANMMDALGVPAADIQLINAGISQRHADARAGTPDMGAYGDPNYQGGYDPGPQAWETQAPAPQPAAAPPSGGQPGRPPTQGVGPRGRAPAVTAAPPPSGGYSQRSAAAPGISGMGAQEDPATSGLILPPNARELTVQADRRNAEARAGMAEKARGMGGGKGNSKGRDDTPRQVVDRPSDAGQPPGTGGPGGGGTGGQPPGGGGAGAYPTAPRMPIIPSTRRPNTVPTSGTYPTSRRPPTAGGGVPPRGPIIDPRPPGGGDNQYQFDHPYPGGGAMGNRDYAGNKLINTYREMIDNPDIDPRTRNDMMVEAAKAARARYAGAGEAIERRGAATGATAGTPAALAYLARDEGGTIADTNRQIRMDLEKERQRRRELGISGMSDLYGTETGYTTALMQGRAGTAQRPSYTTGSGTNSGSSSGINIGSLLAALG